MKRIFFLCCFLLNFCIYGNFECNKELRRAMRLYHENQALETTLLNQRKDELIQLLRITPSATPQHSKDSDLINAILVSSVANGDVDILEELFRHGVKGDGYYLDRLDNKFSEIQRPLTVLAVRQAMAKFSESLNHQHEDVQKYLKVLRLLFGNGANIDDDPGLGNHATFLHMAAYFGDDDLVSYLLQQGANPYARTGGFFGYTPREQALYMGHSSTAQLLP